MVRGRGREKVDDSTSDADSDVVEADPVYEIDLTSDTEDQQ
jgi:hypothetical protein